MRGLLKELPAWGISFAVNATVLLVCHFVILEAIVPAFTPEIVTVLDDSSPVVEREYQFSEDVHQENVGNGGALGVFTPAMNSAMVVGNNREAPLQEKLEQILNPDVPRLAEASLVRLEGNMAQPIEVKGHSDDAVGGIEGAMDRMAFEIRQGLRDRKTLVIWLMDASGSLTERRSKIADRFDNIYRQLGKTGPTDGLYSAVVSYGDQATLLTPEPTQDTRTLSEIVRMGVRGDGTSHENVFSTVRMVLDKYRQYRRSEGPWNKMIVIVTDEKGDDEDAHLEEAISQARRQQTKIFTIGNSGIFGREKGYVRWVYEDGFVGDVEVDQGPEVAFPDLVQLPFIDSQDDWRLRQMSASYGPYALTRLCSETGGLYLITEESRGYAFDRAIMRAYTPDYRPKPEIAREIDRNPAKAALVNIATLEYDRNLPRPQLVFRAFDDTVLRQDITEAQRPIAEVDFMLARLLSALSAGEAERNSLTEPRWKAAFDLAMGRVLAMRVRYFGYNQQLANMKVAPKPFANPENNMWRLAPSDQIDTGPEIRKAADSAKKYLNRVIAEHPGTPWELLAKRELSSDLGWSWQEFYQQPPPAPGSPEERAMLLLAEEQQRQRQQQPQAPPRVPPKL